MAGTNRLPACLHIEDRTFTKCGKENLTLLGLFSCQSFLWPDHGSFLQISGVHSFRRNKNGVHQRQNVLASALWEGSRSRPIMSSPPTRAAGGHAVVTGIDIRNRSAQKEGDQCRSTARRRSNAPHMFAQTAGSTGCPQSAIISRASTYTIVTRPTAEAAPITQITSHNSRCPPVRGGKASSSETGGWGRVSGGVDMISGNGMGNNSSEAASAGG